MTGKAAAERLQVDRSTIYRWSTVGILHPVKTAGGLRRYLVEEVQYVASRLEAGEEIESPAGDAE